MKLRARWIGPPPRTGDYLMSELRPRFAYRIDQVDNATALVHWDPAAKAETRRLRISATRIPKDRVPPHARIHAWKWDRRESRSKISPKREPA